MKLFIKILLFVLVAFVTNVKVANAATTFPDYQQTGTSFSFHKEIAKTVYNVFENDGGIDVGEKGFIEKNSKTYNGYDYIDFGGNEGTALDYFRYGTANTNVEYSVKTESGISIAGTSHKTNSVNMLIYDRRNVTLFGHSHPQTGASAIEPSGVVFQMC